MSSNVERETNREDHDRAREYNYEHFRTSHFLADLGHLLRDEGVQPGQEAPNFEAEEAGFSKGAVYSNFEGKEDLFVVLLEQRIGEMMRVVNEVFEAEQPLQAQLQEVGRRIGDLTGQERDWSLLFMEFWAYAVRNSELRPKFAARYAALRTSVAELIETHRGGPGTSLPASSEHLASAVIAMADGIALQRLVDPEALPEQLFGTALTVFFSGLPVQDEREL